MLKRTLSTALLCIFTLSLGAISTAQAQQDLQIGYVDPQSVLNKMPEMKAVQQRLKNFVENKREEYADKQKNFQKQVSDYQQKQSVISESAKKEEEERLGKMNQQLQQYQGKMRQEVQEKQQELVGPLLDQIDTAISTVSKRMNLTYVINTRTSQSDVVVLYASEKAKQKYDITKEVMDELDI